MAIAYQLTIEPVTGRSDCSRQSSHSWALHGKGRLTAPCDSGVCHSAHDRRLNTRVRRPVYSMKRQFLRRRPLAFHLAPNMNDQRCQTQSPAGLWAPIGTGQGNVAFRLLGRIAGHGPGRRPWCCCLLPHSGVISDWEVQHRNSNRTLVSRCQIMRLGITGAHMMGETSRLLS